MGHIVPHPTGPQRTVQSPERRDPDLLAGVYRELPTTAGTGVRCAWERDAGTAEEPLIVPDGCADLVWYDDGRLEVAGPDTGARRTPLRAGARIVGLRLAPGAVPAVLGVPAAALRDQQPLLADVDPRWRRLAGTEPDRTALEDAVAGVERVPADRVVAVALRMIERAPSTRVRDVADAIGISTRHLGRRFDAAVGYGPKTFARVARLERFVRSAAAADGDLATAALTAGYASQSHLGDEVRALTTLTPVRFLEDRGRRAP